MRTNDHNGIVSKQSASKGDELALTLTEVEPTGAVRSMK